MATEDQTSTTTATSSDMLKKALWSALGTIVSYYITQWTTKKLQEKPLMTRVREGKESIIDFKDQAKVKAASVATAAKIKLDDKATSLNALIQEKKEDVKDTVDTAKDKIDEVTDK